MVHLHWVCDFRICFFVDFLPMKNKAKMDLNIMEITYINEMALTVGLILTIGNFLGGQWLMKVGTLLGMGSKETWALISIMVMHCYIPDCTFCVENGCLT
jgi:ABC-type transport system involved in cytochrome c biogenesis permease subunit